MENHKIFHAVCKMCYRYNILFMIYLMSNDDAILIKTSPLYMVKCSKQNWEI